MRTLRMLTTRLCTVVCTVLAISRTLGTRAQSRHLQRPLQYISDGIPSILLPTDPKTSSNDSDVMPALLDALNVMQHQYFQLWRGIWDRAIDWTSAVMGTHISSALRTFSRSGQNENLIDKYFSQLTAFYFGQDAFALRQQAYDDMLWVVLSWLESIRFIEGQAAKYEDPERWHGMQFTPAFAHRARLFWEFAAKGWDQSLCHGGMLWRPSQEQGSPYKNAITNELFIAASIAMYLHFPGDDNDSTFEAADIHPAQDPRYLAAAVEGYRWLSNSNMTDAAGLYVDGYHISNWADVSRDGSIIEKKCDERNEMVYTYNQGVLLTGQRGLYDATGAKSYLEDGHGLIESVIAATGWNLTTDRPPPPPHFLKPPATPRFGEWQGLGRSGVLEEFCDARADCSQDAQTFKGIFFHHFTAFCAKLPNQLAIEGATALAYDEIAQWHSEKCKRYTKWVRHNAKAALLSRDVEGRFGMWWGAPESLGEQVDLSVLRGERTPDGAVDYRNDGGQRTPLRQRSCGMYDGLDDRLDDGRAGGRHMMHGHLPNVKEFSNRDLNDRGRGRSVETQGGGVALLRACWELEHPD